MLNLHLPVWQQLNPEGAPDHRVGVQTGGMEWDWQTGSEWSTGRSASAAKLYERYLVPAIFGPWADDLVALAGLRGGERVLDLACGTGVVARRAQEVLGEAGAVVGADINLDMLAVARGHSANPAIEWRGVDVRALPFDDGEFDVAFCQQGLQFVPDRTGTLREVWRVLRAGGLAVIAVWSSIEDSPGFDALANAIGSHIGAEAAAALRRGPFGYDPRNELEPSLFDTGFSQVRVEEREKLARFPSPEEFIRSYTLSTPLASAFSQADPNVRMRMIDEVAEALTQYTSPVELAFPTVACVAMATR